MVGGGGCKERLHGGAVTVRVPRSMTSINSDVTPSNWKPDLADLAPICSPSTHYHAGLLVSAARGFDEPK